MRQNGRIECIQGLLVEDLQISLRLDRDSCGLSTPCGRNISDTVPIKTRTTVVLAPMKRKVFTIEVGYNLRLIGL